MNIFICIRIFYILFLLAYGLYNGLFDHVYMNVNDMLNPVEDTNDQGQIPKSSTGNSNSGDPDPNDGKKGPSNLKDDYAVNEYTALADKLENKREELLEQRRTLGSKSNHTTLGDLGIPFQRFETRAQQHEAKLIRDVLPDAYSSTTINKLKLIQIRQFKP